MLVKKPSGRLPIGAIEAHHYFDGVDWDAHRAGTITPPWVPRPEPKDCKERVRFEAGLPYVQLLLDQNAYLSYDYCSPAFKEAVNAVPPPSPSRLKTKLLRLFVNRSTDSARISAKQVRFTKSWWISKSPWSKKTTRPVAGKRRMDLLV